MNESVHINYLTSNEQDKLWGLTVRTAGYQKIPPRTDYPPRNHPQEYLFSTQKGRTLDEYVLLYITNGKGRFSSSTQKDIEIKSGNMILLFPGEWHTYQPDISMGWDEYWIGFRGTQIDSLVLHAFFSRENEIFDIGPREEIVQLYKSAIHAASKEKPGFQQLLSGIVSHLLGIIYSVDKDSTFNELKSIRQIEQAKIIIRENFHTGIKPEHIAGETGMSYSWFRRLFKQYTGLSPYRYIQELRIQKSKELLGNTTLTCQEIAYQVGYDNSNQFGIVFKKCTGLSPTAYRYFSEKGNPT